MAIRSVLINVGDVQRSVDFYTRHLGAEVVSADENGAELDVVTARIRLARIDTAEATTWIPDDLQAGFRHVGFKVTDLDARVAALHDGGVPFHLEPIHAEGDVRITFFYDPDGTLLELVEGPLQYHEVYDQAAVDADWALTPTDRPVFDHVAETVTDLDATTAYFGQLGYSLMSGIHQPSDDRGFEINYFRNGDTSLEVFTYERAEKAAREPQITAPGFVAVELDGVAPAEAVTVGSAFGHELMADSDGLVHAVSGASAAAGD